MTSAQLPFRPSPRRRGFTLVELLVVALILVILFSLVIGAMFAATEEAKEARTRTQIAKLHELLMTRWEEYQVRRVPIPVNVSNPLTERTARLNGIRELMRMELPDRITDVTDPPVSGIPIPALTRAYQARVAAAQAQSGKTWSPAYQGAECLYLIVSQMEDGMGKGLDHFRANEIGDVDDDGMPEILDGWGRPIEFLRWAPGFDYPNSLIQNSNMPADERYDPFDPTNADTRGPFWPLYPLVFSAGADGVYDINVLDASFRYRQTNPPNDPYHQPSGTPRAGTPMDVSDGFGGGPNGRNEWYDNITNHTLTVPQ